MLARLLHNLRSAELWRLPYQAKNRTQLRLSQDEMLFNRPLSTVEVQAAFKFLHLNMRGANIEACCQSSSQILSHMSSHVWSDLTLLKLFFSVVSAASVHTSLISPVTSFKITRRSGSLRPLYAASRYEVNIRRSIMVIRESYSVWTSLALARISLVLAITYLYPWFAVTRPRDVEEVSPSCSVVLEMADGYPRLLTLA